MSETFCQICRHETPGHVPGCPVLSGEPQRGWEYPYGINPQDMQPYPHPLNQIQQGQMGAFPPDFTPSQIETRILAETLGLRADIAKLLKE